MPGAICTGCTLNALRGNRVAFAAKTAPRVYRRTIESIAMRYDSKRSCRTHRAEDDDARTDRAHILGRRLIGGPNDVEELGVGPASRRKKDAGKIAFDVAPYESIFDDRGHKAIRKINRVSQRHWILPRGKGRGIRNRVCAVANAMSVYGHRT